MTWQRGIKIAVGVKATNCLTLKSEVILDCPGKPNVIKRVLKCGRGSQVSVRVRQSEKDSAEPCWLLTSFRNEARTWATTGHWKTPDDTVSSPES
jgi:hypothetical protein